MGLLEEKPWIVGEEKRLREIFAEGLSDEKIAEKMTRTWEVIQRVPRSHEENKDWKNLSLSHQVMTLNSTRSG